MAEERKAMDRYTWTDNPLDPQRARRQALFEGHRHLVTGMLLGMVPEHGGKLLVLGAGPCNDLGLAELSRRWGQVDLVDLKPEVVRQGMAAQQVAAAANLRVIGMDLVSGRAVEEEGADSSPGASEVQQPEIGAQRLRAIANCQWEGLDRDYDAVVSTCLLSQLVLKVVEELGAEHALFVKVIQALRRRHLQLMAQAIKPGGTGLLLADFVSTDTLPQLWEVQPEQLPQLLGQALKASNFFHGMNPGMILQAARQDPELRDWISQVELSNPWVWGAGEKAYAVVAIKFTRPQ